MFLSFNESEISIYTEFDQLIETNQLIGLGFWIYMGIYLELE